VLKYPNPPKARAARPTIEVRTLTQRWSDRYMGEAEPTHLSIVVVYRP
jgi:hypothetical protein